MERWRAITLEGFEGLYEVSDKGRVRSVDREFIRVNGRLQPVIGRALNPSKDEHGYSRVYLSNQGNYKYMFVHRLVAMEFVSNPFNKPVINHINSKRDDNVAENLEWVTAQENSRHSYKQGFGLKGLHHNNSKQITLSKDGELFSSYESVSKCSDILSVPKKTLRKYISENNLLYGALKIEYASLDTVCNLYPFKNYISSLGVKSIRIENENGLSAVYQSRQVAEKLNDIPSDVLMYPLKKNSLYLKKYKVNYITQFEYLMSDAINLKIITE